MMQRRRHCLTTDSCEGEELSNCEGKGLSSCEGLGSCGGGEGLSSGEQEVLST